MSAILHIHQGKSGQAGPLIEALMTHGVLVRESNEEEVSSTLASEESAFDAAVISPSVRSPLTVARAVHEAKPNAHIVFVTDEEHEGSLRRSLMLAPRIGTQWSVVKSESAGVAADAIRSAVDGAARRRQLRTTINRLNVQIARPDRDSTKRGQIVSDHFIATVFDQLSDAVIMLDTAGKVLTSNTAASRAIGRNIARGADISELLGPLPDQPTDLPELKVTTEDGREVVLEVRTQAVNDENQRRIGTAVVARDVTQRHHSENRRVLLTQSTEHLSQTVDMRAALDHLATVLAGPLADVCVIDIMEGDRLHRYSAVAAREEDQRLATGLKGYAPVGDSSHPALQVLEGKPTFVRNDVEPELWDEIAPDSAHRDLIERLEIHSFVAAAITSGEQVLGVLTVARGRSPARFSSDDVELIVEVARRAGMALHNAWLYHEAEQANRAKDAFLATLSHELRTPMTSILGWLQILKMGQNDEESLREGLTVIEQSARAQAQLIDDLLDLSRIDAGKLHMEPVNVRLADIIRAAVDTISPAAAARRIEVETRLDADVYVMGDPNRLQQAVWNLLSNAVKFCSKEGRVSVTLERFQSLARLAITDDGRGISPAFLPYVFDRFRQADSATTRSFGGLGLGLSLVRQIVELHGGTVTAESEGEGHGSTFTVMLPVLALQSVQHLPDQPEPPDIPELSGARILVVEDDRASAGMIAALLRRAGAEVAVVNSVKDALSSIRELRPDLLISDIAMPQRDGYELIRRVRNTLHIDEETLPAIALTAFGGAASRIAVLGAGFQRHVQKPADVHDLLGVVAELLGRGNG